jgi:methyl-accepting chemotaxis protein
MALKLTIGKKLALAFGTTLAFMAVVAAFGLMRLGDVADGMNTVVEVYNKQTRLAATMRIAINEEMIAGRGIALVESPEDVKPQQELITAARKAYDAAEKELAAMFAGRPATSADEKAALARITKARERTRPLMNKAIELATANRAWEATQVLLKEAAQPQGDWQAALAQLATLEEKLADQAAADAKQTYARAVIEMLAIGIVAALVAGAYAFFLTRNLLRQLGGEPDYAATIADAIAAGDLSTPIAIAPSDRSSLLFGMQRMQSALATLVQTIRAAADSIATGSSQIAAGNTDLSQRTEEQASNLQQTASSMEQLTATVKSHADTARQATQVASQASECAGQGSQAVGKLRSTMQGIDQASSRIGAIIGTIDGIAFQTNILALNAAVEAARAGEQGRGFAVVAGEVRALAMRCAEAAREIKQLIGESAAKVELGSAQVKDAAGRMDEILAGVRRVTDLMGDMDASSTEQSQGISQVSDAVSQLDQVTQQNAALVEQSAAAAESLRMQADRLVASVAAFRLADGVAA